MFISESKAIIPPCLHEERTLHFKVSAVVQHEGKDDASAEPTEPMDWFEGHFMGKRRAWVEKTPTVIWEVPVHSLFNWFKEMQEIRTGLGSLLNSLICFPVFYCGTCATVL
jgi:hypothetical protein